ncbi:hypothetical protein BHE74_00025933 [Ensete ventricosum]|nr:hypothetical protein BHE74_00025933 [Ensete ventricosum]RZR99978.1 hypothetical protein BHM03_00029611 [Ensete ventricosum]
MYASLYTVDEAVRLTASTRNPWREKCGGSQTTRRGVSIGSSREHTQRREGPIDRRRFGFIVHVSWCGWSDNCDGVANPTRSSVCLPRSGRLPSDLRRRVEIGSCTRDPSLWTVLEFQGGTRTSTRTDGRPSVGFEVVVSRSSFEEGSHQRLLFPF